MDRALLLASRLPLGHTPSATSSGNVPMRTPPHSEPDDWRAEIQERLKQSRIYLAFKKKCDSIPAGAAAAALVDEAVHYAYQRTKTVLLHMREFTLHDGDHLFRVLFMMDNLIPPATLNQLSVPECMLLILTAFFHDIGMAPSEDEVQGWYSFFDSTGSGSTTTPLTQQSFSQFATARPETLSLIEHHRQQGRHSQAQLLESYLVSDYIRLTHADRSKEIIHNEWSGRILFRDIDLTTDFAELCYSHNEDIFNLNNLDASLPCGPDTFVCKPFIGVILRLADILDFDAKRTPQVLFSHLSVNHPVSIAEWNKHRSIAAWTFTQSTIVFVARCEHPAIECTIRRFCDLIDHELLSANVVLTRLHDNLRSPFPEYYRIPLPTHIDRSKIEPKKDAKGQSLYRYKDLMFTLNHSQIIDLLMGTKLYGDPEITLRELLQNSIDACLLRLSLERTWERGGYKPTIIVALEQHNGRDYLIVDDNGTGMDQYIIDTYYSKIGSSFYNSSDFYRIRAETDRGFKPTSRFGIGILACFMVADALSVETRRLLGPHSSGDPVGVLIEGPDSVFWIRSGTRDAPGTRTELMLRPGHPWETLSCDELRKVVEGLVPASPIRIEVRAPKGRAKSIRGYRKIAAEHFRSWRTTSHARNFDISLDDRIVGIGGRAVVAILEDAAGPTDRLELFRRSVSIEGEFGSYTLDNELRVAQDSIDHHSDSLTIEGHDIDVSNSWSSECSSIAHISVHGFSVPMTIFRSVWGGGSPRSKVRLCMPFPVFLQVDFYGNTNLSLNTSRTEIIFDEKWTQCARILINKILLGIKQQVKQDYWHRLVEIMQETSNDDMFLGVLREIAIE